MILVTEAAHSYSCYPCNQRWTVIFGDLTECPQCKGKLKRAMPVQIVEVVQ